MYKHKNKRSPKALTARAARAPAPVAAAAATSKKAKLTSLLEKIADKVTDTGLAVLHRLEEIPVVKKAEALAGVRQGQ